MSAPLSSDLSSKNSVNHSEYEDERRKKKKEKARMKELKKQNALEKAQLAKLKAQGSNAPKKSANQEAHDENLEDYVDPETPFGEKKRLSSQMSKQYSPGAVEWYAWWEKSGFFLPDADNSKPPFMIVLPPPNVTGVLHIGHALTIAIHVVLDTIIRWRRMSGYRAVWVPSLDHAGIATQSWTNERAEYEMGLVDCTARSLRSLRAELPANRKNERLPAFALCQNDELVEFIRSRELEISTLAILSSLKVLRSGVDAAPVGCAFENVNESLIVYLKVQGTLNAEAEREKIKKKMNELQKSVHAILCRFNLGVYGFDKASDLFKILTMI